MLISSTKKISSGCSALAPSLDGAAPRAVRPSALPPAAPDVAERPVDAS
ncbi:hypothetical protein WME99_32055 [Sorangium sp. So ce136]